MKVSSGVGTKWTTDLINNIVKKCCIPENWRKSILVPVYKGIDRLNSKRYIDAKMIGHISANQRFKYTKLRIII